MTRRVRHLEKLNLHDLANEITSDYHNFVVANVNDHVLRMSVMNGEFHWHRHPGSDEIFIVLEGELQIDLEEKTEVLGPGDCFVVPKGKLHRTRAVGRTVNLTIEHEGTSQGGIDE